MLSQRIEGGGTLRDQAHAAFRQRGFVPEHLRSLPIPTGTEYLWEWFNELQGARTSNGFGANPITYTEMAAWATLSGRDLEPFEVRLLKDLDLLYLSAVAEASASRKEQKRG